MVDFQFSDNITHSSQRLNITKSSNDPNVRILHPPSRAKAFGRIVLNVLSCGTYTSCYDNPRQWEEFYKALEESITPEEKDQMDKFLKTIYNEREALTQSKASNVLATLEAWKRGAKPAASTTNEGVDGAHSEVSNTNVHASALRTLAQRFAYSADNKVYSFKINSEIHKMGEAIRNPRRAISNDAIIYGQDALKKQAALKNQSFEYTKIGLSGSTLREVVEKITEKVEPISLKMDALREKGSEGKSAILSIPLRLKRTSQLHEEDHLILIAVDFKTKKILYLDPKATSLDLAHKKYQEQGNNFREDLTQLGKKLFGESFESKTDILELSSPKQKKSSDAGAFIHFFTRAILNDCSPGEIDTNFGIADYNTMRLKFTQEIWNANSGDSDISLYHPIEEDFIPLDNLRGAKHGEGLGKYEIATQEEIADRFASKEEGTPSQNLILKTQERIFCVGKSQSGLSGGLPRTPPQGSTRRAMDELDEGTLPRSLLLVVGKDTLELESKQFPVHSFDSSTVDWPRFKMKLNNQEMNEEIKLVCDNVSQMPEGNQREALEDFWKPKIEQMGRSHGVKSEKQLKQLTKVINDNLEIMPGVLLGTTMANGDFKVCYNGYAEHIRTLEPVLGKERAFYISLDQRIDEGTVLQLSADNNQYHFYAPEKFIFSEKKSLLAKVTFPENDSEEPLFEILSIKCLLEVKPKETTESTLSPSQS